MFTSIFERSQVLRSLYWLQRARRSAAIVISILVASSVIGCAGVSGSLNYDGHKVTGEIHYSP